MQHDLDPPVLLAAFRRGVHGYRIGLAAAFGGGARAIIPGAGDTFSVNGQGSAATGPIWVNTVGVPARFNAKFTYDGFNRLRKVERLNSSGVVVVSVTYTRDGLGRIIGKLVQGPPPECRPGDFRYAWRGRRLLEEYEMISGQPPRT